MASTDAAAKQPPTAFSTTTNPYPKERPDGTTPKAEFSTAYPFILTAKPSRYLRWALWFLVAIVVSITVLTPLGVFTARSNDKVFNDFGTSYVSPVLKRAGCDPGGILEFCNQLGDNVAVINVAPIKFDPVRGLTVGFSGSVSITPTELFLSTPVKIEVDTKTVTVPTGSLGTFSFTSAYTVTADTAAYPFETYEVEFEVIVSSTSRDPTTREEVINLFQIATTGASPFQVPSFVMEPFNVTGLERDYGVGLADENAFPGATFRLKFQRSPLTKFIVIFSWLLMHLWTFMIIFMTLQVVFRDRDPMQFMFWTAASIFSMGTIRGLQPAAPAIGTVGDVVTYIWGIVISSIMAFVLFCVAFRKHKPKSAWDKEFNKKDKASKWRAVLKDEAEVEKKKKEAENPPSVPSK